MSVVKIRNLTKYFGNVIACDHIDIDVKDGEFLALLGPSGCGKTTTLRCIAGLETPEEGDIFIGDLRVNDLEPKDRDIAMVFQNIALYPHMKAFDNMAFSLKMRGIPKSERHERVLDAAKMLQIEELLYRKPDQMSGGQQQRVALARAIVRKPKLFLMDEPLSNLDALVRREIRTEIKRLQRKIGTTTIYVTHDQEEAMTISDRILVMRDGKVQQIGPPMEIYNHPSNKWVGSFVGSPKINFYEGSIIEKKEKMILELEWGNISLPTNICQSLKDNLKSQEVVIGFRPQIVKIVKEGKAIGKAEVDILEPLGSEILVHLKLGNDVCRALVPIDTMITEGEVVGIDLDLQRILIFDKKTGMALF